MARTAQEVADILKKIYYKGFGGDEDEKYQLSWSDLRMLAGVKKLKEPFVAEISEIMSAGHFALLPLAGFLLVGAELDFSCERQLPGRLRERYLPEDDDSDADVVDDDEVED